MHNHPEPPPIKPPRAKEEIALELLDALKELVELKEMKEKYESLDQFINQDSRLIDEYLRRKPLAWITAKRLVVKFKYLGVKA